MKRVLPICLLLSACATMTPEEEATEFSLRDDSPAVDNPGRSPASANSMPANLEWKEEFRAPFKGVWQSSCLSYAPTGRETRSEISVSSFDGVEGGQTLLSVFSDAECKTELYSKYIVFNYAVGINSERPDSRYLRRYWTQRTIWLKGGAPDEERNRRDEMSYHAHLKAIEQRYGTRAAEGTSSPIGLPKPTRLWKFVSPTEVELGYQMDIVSDPKGPERFSIQRVSEEPADLSARPTPLSL